MPHYPWLGSPALAHPVNSGAAICNTFKKGQTIVGAHKVAFRTLYITKVVKLMLDPMLSYTAVTSPECPGCASTITLLYKYRLIGKMVQNSPSIMNQQFVFN